MPASLPIQFLDGPGGSRIAYALHGSGPPLICPAWWISHLEADWGYEPFRRFFNRLGETHTVVRYDRPGAGLSVQGDTTASLATEVAVLEAVFDHLEVPAASLFAVSCAGPTALVFAARRPKQVERLAFYGSYAAGSDIGPPEVFEAFCSLVEAHWGLGSEVLANVLHPALAAGDLREFGRRQRSSGDAELACSLLRLSYGMDASDAVADVPCPVIVIHRRGDRTVPLSAGRKLAAAVPGSSLVTLDGDAHPPWDGDDDVAPLLQAFFASKPLPMGGRSKTAGYGFEHDRGNRELLIDGERRPLTPLEHGLLCYLADRKGSVVTRDAALRDVWQQPFTGSNVVDAVIRTLRRKLGPYCGDIETVTGHGYRLKSNEEDS